MNELRQLVRSLRRPLSGTLLIVAVLAIGIGTTTAVFAVFRQLLFRPIPGVLDENSLITIVYRPDGNRRATAFGSLASLGPLRSANELRHVAAVVGDTYTVEAAGSSSRYRVEFVTSGFFATLGIKPLVGRLITDGEAAQSVDVAVVSEAYWRTRLSSRPLDGVAVKINNQAFAVVGVLQDYRGWDTVRLGRSDIWLPVAAGRVVDGQPLTTASTFVARTAGESLEAIERRLQQIHRATSGDLPPRVRTFVPTVEPGLYSPGTDSPAVKRLYWALTTMAILIVAISAVIAATLFVSRLSRRDHEVAMRLALGSRRQAVAARILVEGGAMATLGWLTGLGVAAACLYFLRGIQVLGSLPPLDGIIVDTRIVFYAGASALVMVLCFASLPAWRVARLNIRDALSRSTPTISLPASFASVSVVSQVALSLALIATAAVLQVSLRNLLSAEMGLDTDHVAVTFYHSDTRDNRATDFALMKQRLLEAGLGDVALASPGPLSASTEAVRIALPGASEVRQMSARVTAVSPNYFEVLSMRMIHGHGFAPDASGAAVPQQVVINAKLARLLFGSVNVTGRSFGLEHLLGQQFRHDDVVVAGVVGDTRPSGIRGEAVPQVYHLGQSGWPEQAVLIRLAQPMSEHFARLNGFVDSLPGADLGPPVLLGQIVGAAVSSDRALATVSALTAAISIALALLGVYAVVNQNVVQRTREIGILSALGAGRSQIVLRVLSSTGRQYVAGLVAGTGLYLLAARALEGTLFGVHAFDLWPLAASGSVLLITVLLAASLPAVKATRIDPTVVLKR